MSAPTAFRSPLAEAMELFVAFKRMQGYEYSHQAGMLGYFDCFLLGRDCADGLLRPAHFDAYLATTAGLCHSTREGRLSVVRQFSRHLHAYHPESAVVPARLLPRHCRSIRFRRIEPEQVRELMDAAGRLRPKLSVRPPCIRFLIGLLYTTGLRIGEALRLNLEDIDHRNGTLFVRRGKFGKERLVALADTTLGALDVWLHLRSRHASASPSAPLLAGRPNTRLTYCQAKYAFGTLCRQCGLEGQPPPRLHDLRHNFACRCIGCWREEGKDVDVLLPVLANAMGHVDIFTTQIYIHIEAASLHEASDRLLEHVGQQRETER